MKWCCPCPRYGNGGCYRVRMNAAIIGLIGTLAGVLFGSGLTFLFARRNAISGRMHESRIDAYKSFAAAVMELRRALLNRWFVRHGDDGTPPDDVYAIRSTAWSAYYAVQLVSQDKSLAEKAKQALDLIASMKDAPDEESLNERSDHGREALSLFVDAARDDIAAKTRVL